MEYLPFVLIAVLLLFMAFPLYIWLSSKRMQGGSAPAYDDLLAPEQRDKAKLLFYFYSQQCGPCRTLTPLVERMAERYGNVVKVDVMQQGGVAQRFAIRATPTLVLVEGDTLVKVILGPVGEKQLDLLLH